MPTASSLAQALVAAQKAMPAVEKDGKNPHFNNKFATLDNLLAKVRPVLNEHGIAVMQFPSLTDLGQPTLVTRFVHQSGESIEYAMPIFPSKNDPQGHGSAITYARRYALASALGIASESDDDGNAASRPAPTPAKTASNGSESNAEATSGGYQGNKPDEPATPPQSDLVNKLIIQLADVLDSAKIRKGMESEYGTADATKLTRSQAHELIERLKAKAAEAKNGSSFQAPAGAQA